MKRKTLIILVATLILISSYLCPVFSQEKQGSSINLPHKIFKLSNRPADSVMDVLKIYLSKDGVMVVDKRLNALIVKDHPENLAKIEDLIRELDVPAPQVRISVKFMGRTNSSTAGIYGSAHKGKNGWVIGVNPNFTNTETSMTNSMNLAIMSGYDGFIKMGERVPYASWFYDYALGRGYVTGGVIFQDVTTGFFVTPEVRGDNVEVRIAPGINYFDGKNTNKIIFREAETQVSMKDGQSMVIGVGESSEKGSLGLISRIVGAGSFSADEVFTMTLTVNIIKGI